MSDNSAVRRVFSANFVGARIALGPEGIWADLWELCGRVGERFSEKLQKFPLTTEADRVPIEKVA